MGDFEVSLTYHLKAEDQHDAAQKAFRLICDMTPDCFWIKNEAGVAEEVKLDEDRKHQAMARGRKTIRESDLATLLNELLGAGIAIGAHGDDPRLVRERYTKAEQLKRRIIDLYI
jgi:hypothetical protein